MKFRLIGGLGALLLLGLAPTSTLAADRADAQLQVDKAQSTFERFASDPDMTWFRNHVGMAGLTVGTILTMIIVPTFYSLLYGVREPKAAQATQSHA
jgi:hypothetical protein